MTDPYAPPKAQMVEPAAQAPEVEKIRIGQKLLIYAILLNIGVSLAAISLPILGLLQFLVLGVSIFGLVRLFQGMRTAMWARVLLFISMIIPLVNLLVLLGLNGRATKALRRAGYKVGLMGASKRVA